MKRTALQLTLAAATMLAAAATGSAQNLKAEVPFPFDVGGAHMQPGNYAVVLNVNRSAMGVTQLINDDNGHSVLALPSSTDRPYSGPLQYTLSFTCEAGRCELFRLQNGSTIYNYGSLKKREGVQIATVMLRNAKS